MEIACRHLVAAAFYSQRCAQVVRVLPCEPRVFALRFSGGGGAGGARRMSRSMFGRKRSKGSDLSVSAGRLCKYG